MRKGKVEREQTGFLYRITSGAISFPGERAADGVACPPSPIARRLPPIARIVPPVVAAVLPLAMRCAEWISIH